ncbi:MAG: hypothetical protein ACOX3W_05065 [Christensenellaceae bacterium]|jgi:hypothetical protein
MRKKQFIFFISLLLLLFAMLGCAAGKENPTPTPLALPSAGDLPASNAPENKVSPEPAKEEREKLEEKFADTVYWTPNGEKYHISKDCSALTRAKEIHSGTIDDIGTREKCKICG